MLQFDATIVVAEDRTCTLRVPNVVGPGRHRVRVVIEAVEAVAGSAAAPAARGDAATFTREVEDAVGNDYAQGAAYEAVYRARSARG